MAHRYRDPVPVERGEDGLPTSFVWRGKTYVVKEVLGKWHLMDRWWVPPCYRLLGGYDGLPLADRWL